MRASFHRLGLLLGLVALLVSGFAHAQTTYDYGRQIEAVRSVAGAQAFVDSLEAHHGVWPRMYLDSLQQHMRENCEACGVQVPSAWVRADLDGDNVPDLLLSGEHYTVAYLNRGAAPPQVELVTRRGNSRGCQAATLAHRASLPVIRGREVEYVSEKLRAKGRKPRRWNYTLVYWLGGFVDYVARPRLMLPRQLAYFHSNGGPPSDSYRAYRIQLDLATGQVTGESRAPGDSLARGPFQYQLSAGALDTLRQHLRYLRLSGLRRHYERNASDATIDRLELHYRFRPAKKVDDYGRMAPHSLQRINDLLATLHERDIEQRRARSVWRRGER